MQRSTYLWAVAVISIAFSNSASGEPIEIKEVMLDKLRAQQPDPIEVNVSGVRVLWAWDLANITAVSRGVTQSQVKISAIPDSIYTDTYTQRNCTGDPQKLNVQLAVVFNEGHQVTLSRSLTVSDRESLQVKVPIVNSDLSLNQDVTVVNGTSLNQNSLKQDSETQVIEVVVPPYTERTFRLEKRVSNGFLAFDGAVIVDADVSWRLLNGTRGPVKKGKLSDYFSESDRTLQVSGEIMSARAKQKTYTYTDTKLDPIASRECQINPSSVEPPQAFLQRSAIDSPPAQVIESLPDGDSITTAAVVANIEVRAKSHGPGFCATSVSSGANTVRIAAPPVVWSSWYAIDSHVGRVTRTYSIDSECDTGSLVEIRYYR